MMRSSVGYEKFFVLLMDIGNEKTRKGRRLNRKADERRDTADASDVESITI